MKFNSLSNYCFIPVQDLLSKEEVAKALEIEFINRTNDVGVDVNRAIDHPHVAVLIPFICGLGPRKGGDLIKVMIVKDLLIKPPPP